MTMLKNLMVALSAFALMALAVQSQAQENGESAKTEAMAKPANPEDVASVEAIIEAVYDVISGPAGPRDWARMRSLFIAEPRMAVRNPNAPNGIRVFTLDDYIKNSGAYFLENGFFETGIHNEIALYDSIAHVFSTYESRREADAEPFARGINSIQLLHHDDRWWVVSIYWQQESEDAPIPAQFLPKAE